jgi:hypothetical protein
VASLWVGPGWSSNSNNESVLKKKQKNKSPKIRPSDLSDAELAKLRQSLVETPMLSDGDFVALAKSMERANDAAGLQNLVSIAANKEQTKALKRSFHHLGISLKPEASRVLSGLSSGEKLPMLMAAPGPNGTRIFTFAIPASPTTVTVIEAYFCMPEGLYRLKSSPSTPSGYRSWATGMVQKGRVMMPKGMLERKKWEIRYYAKKNQTGKEFDRGVADMLDWPSQTPAHPASLLELGQGPTLTMDQLHRRKALVPFNHATAAQVLQKDLNDAGGDMISSRDSEGILNRSVSEWAQQWGFEAITELLMDYAVYFARRPDADVARTLRDVADNPEPALRRAQILQFLEAYVKEDLV